MLYEIEAKVMQFVLNLKYIELRSLDLKVECLKGKPTFDMSYYAASEAMPGGSFCRRRKRSPRLWAVGDT